MRNSRAVILCGGQSSRMGVDKATLQDLHGRYLLEGMAQTLLQRFDEVVLVRHGDEPLPVSQDRVIVVKDLPGADGPLCGICSGLLGADGYVFVTACDMPNISVPIIDAMLEAVRFDPRATICAGISEGFVQPFHAMYHAGLVKSMLPKIGNTSPVRFIKSQPHILLPESALRALCPDLCVFANLNRPDAYLQHIQFAQDN